MPLMHHVERLSISDPRYNVREIVKQMLLLEQHLLEESKYCPDCISKHILTIEALAEEGQNLDRNQEWSKTFTPLVGKARVWGAAFSAGAPPKHIGQAVRKVRKTLAPDLQSELDQLDTTELAGFIGPDMGTGEWKVWAVLFAGLAAGVWLTERRLGPNAQRRLT
jgi:hypothetical protein